MQRIPPTFTSERGIYGNNMNPFVAERLQTDKISNEQTYSKPRGDSNSQPRGSFHGSIQLSYWASFNVLN